MGEKKEEEGEEDKKEGGSWGTVPHLALFHHHELHGQTRRWVLWEWDTVNSGEWCWEGYRSCSGVQSVHGSSAESR
jgi:hypothetical protein